jgi:hypothetical protein
MKKWLLAVGLLLLSVVETVVSGAEGRIQALPIGSSNAVYAQFQRTCIGIDSVISEQRNTNIGIDWDQMWGIGRIEKYQMSDGDLVTEMRRKYKLLIDSVIDSQLIPPPFLAERKFGGAVMTRHIGGDGGARIYGGASFSRPPFSFTLGADGKYNGYPDEAVNFEIPTIYGNYVPIAVGLAGYESPKWVEGSLWFGRFTKEPGFQELGLSEISQNGYASNCLKGVALYGNGVVFLSATFASCWDGKGGLGDVMGTITFWYDDAHQTDGDVFDIETGLIIRRIRPDNLSPTLSIRSFAGGEKTTFTQNAEGVWVEKLLTEGGVEVIISSNIGQKIAVEQFDGTNWSDKIPTFKSAGLYRFTTKGAGNTSALFRARVE